MQTSTFEVQTQREEMNRKPAEQIVTAVLIFSSRLRFSFSSESRPTVKPFSNMQCTNAWLGSHSSGMGKLFARRAALQKILKPRAALIGRVK